VIPRMKSRLDLPEPASLDASQREVYDTILASRGSLDGPFLAWLHSPELAARASHLGAFCRFGTSLSLRESELLILSVAAHFDCLGEQQIHEPIAIRAGLAAADVERLRNRQVVVFEDERLAILGDLAGELLSRNRIEARTFDRALGLLGKKAMVETIGVIGYYTLVAMTLNAFEMTTAAKSSP
jgi:4-carboxymuconolactone decarboxylase